MAPLDAMTAADGDLPELRQVGALSLDRQSDVVLPGASGTCRR